MEEPKKDVIGEIFESMSSPDSDNSKELFEVGKDITLRTDLKAREVVLVNVLSVENEMINSDLKDGDDDDFDLYGDFLDSFKRHKISLDRQSRSEFVQVNLKNTLDRDLNRVSSLKNLADTRN